jgi:predicted transcriptional regulator
MFDQNKCDRYNPSMKIAVSIPDAIFHKAEALAAETGRTRSALYAEALAEMLQRIEDERIKAQINAAIAVSGPIEVEPGRFTAQRRELERDGKW